jgi:hypothetical protein
MSLYQFSLFLCLRLLQLAGSFSGLFGSFCSHEHVSVLSVLCCALPTAGFGLFPGVCSQTLSVLSVLLFGLATAGSFTRLFLGVCSHEPLSVLSVLCSALAFSAGSFLAVPGCLLSLSKCQFSVFSALRLLQRWFFHLAVPGVSLMSLDQFSLFSALRFLQLGSFTRLCPGCLLS